MAVFKNRVVPGSLVQRLLVAVGVVGAGVTTAIMFGKSGPVTFPLAIGGHPTEEPLPVTKQFDKMIAAKLTDGEEADSLAIGFAARNAGLSEQDFVARSRGTASSPLVGKYYSVLMPWIADARKSAELGSDHESPAQVAAFVKETKQVRRARLAVLKSGVPDYSWVEHADLRVGGDTLADRNMDAAFAATQLQAEAFPSGDSYLSYSDFARVTALLTEKRLDQVDQEAKDDFIGKAGLKVDAAIRDKVEKDPVLEQYFEDYAEGMRKSSSVAAYSLGKGAGNSGDVRHDLAVHFGEMDAALQAARVHVRQVYPDRLLPVASQDLPRGISGDRFLLRAPGHR